MLYAVPRCSPAARATSLALSGRSAVCNVRRTLAAAMTAPTGLPDLARAESLEALALRAASAGSPAGAFTRREMTVELADGDLFICCLAKRVDPQGAA